MLGGPPFRCLQAGRKTKTKGQGAAALAFFVASFIGLAPAPHPPAIAAGWF